MMKTLALLLLLSRSFAAQSLAEAAEASKKARAEAAKKNGGAPVWTPAPVIPATVPAPAATQPASTKMPTVSSKSDDTKKDESWWRTNALRLRRQLAANKELLLSAQVNLGSANSSTRSAEVIGDARTEYLRLLAVVVTDEAALLEFEEEARKAGMCQDGSEKNN